CLRSRLSWAASKLATTRPGYPPGVIRAIFGRFAACLLMCWFLDAGNKVAPQAQLTGVQKAPKHEVAGGWAPAGQRALWGLYERGHCEASFYFHAFFCST